METEKKRKAYDRQFNIEAVNMYVNGGRTVEGAARELGISTNSLHQSKRIRTDRDSRSPVSLIHPLNKELINRCDCNRTIKRDDMLALQGVLS